MIPTWYITAFCFLGAITVLGGPAQGPPKTHFSNLIAQMNGGLTRTTSATQNPGAH